MESPWERDLVAPHLLQKVMGPRVKAEWPSPISVKSRAGASEKGWKLAECLAAERRVARMYARRSLRWWRL